MKESKYFKEYLTEQGSKWKFSFDFENNEGKLIETETKSSYPLLIKEEKISFSSDVGQVRFESLTEIERKWVENCFSEILFLCKK